jgi:hypothetical protein
MDTSNTVCGPTQNDIVGKAGTGAVLSLDAIGLQDTFLTSNAGNSFFQFKGTTHTQFTQYSASVQLNNDGSTNWPFNQKVQVLLRPKEMGDILNNMYLKCSLPSLAGLPGNPQYCTDVGLAMINQIQFAADDTILEVIKTDWNVLYTELYYTAEEKVTFQKLVNVDSVNGGDLYIPLHFFFSRRHSSSFTGDPLVKGNMYFKPGFLTCAAHKHRNLIITIQFNPITFFSSVTTTALFFNSFYIVTNEIVLSEAERTFIQNNVQKNLVSLTRNDSVYTVRQTPFVANLTPNIPVKVVHWFIRNQAYEDQTNSLYYNNRFNFSGKNYVPFSKYDTLTQQETNNPVISETMMYLNGVQLTGLSLPVSIQDRRDGSYYFKFLQPLSHSLSSPSRNIYTYSFCLNPADPQPSGALDFGQMDSRSTFINASLYSLTSSKQLSNAYSMYIFYTGFNTVTYNNGLVSLDFGW